MIISENQSLQMEQKKEFCRWGTKRLKILQMDKKERPFVIGQKKWKLL
jgi:hypothetical protein